MNDELITVRGVVRALEGGDALVEVEQGGCGRCHEEGGCGGQQLTQMFCSGPKSYRAENTIGAGIGDRVVVATPAGSVRRTANLAYGAPLLGAIGGALVGMPIGGDPGAMLGAVCGLLAALAYVRLRSRLGAGGVQGRPRLVSHS
ncbi:SoxR reducing system RseC family protein [uncultured Dechloromonas sp.]|uniref:SoxR reducing system RseC family protein n=1 Tax=uncultured Dechloromonas sp. TaxID=171719 RepID=UPI0025FB53E8|nr:SoxR reducing system RseC family protein [uncultured Dechloromonas sp.]